MTSQMALATVPISNQARIPLIAPTVSTNQLIGLDDYFFRVYYSNAQAAVRLASRLAETGAVKRMVVIYDTGNRAYTEDWLNIFREHFQKMNGEIVAALSFTMQQDTLFSDLAEQATSFQPDGILFLANALDTALLCQQIAKQKISVERFATGWSYSDDLLVFGGHAVEGLMLIQSADLSSRNERFTTFKKEYEQRFHEPVNFPAVHAYDATRLVLAALDKSAPDQDLKKALLALNAFDGLQGQLSFDRFGDLRDPKIFLSKIVNGQFVNLD
jgi:branched-chain amino acid transport system substrate-binding protein